MVSYHAKLRMDQKKLLISTLVLISTMMCLAFVFEGDEYLEISTETDMKPILRRRDNVEEENVYRRSEIKANLDNAPSIGTETEDENSFEWNSTLKESDEDYLENNSDNLDYYAEEIKVDWDWVQRIQPECSLIHDQKKAPLPIVFVAKGRTGSSVTYSAILKLMGEMDPVKAFEITGRFPEESEAFFNDILPNELAASWPSAYLCALQQYEKVGSAAKRSLVDSRPIVAFQWKPFLSTLRTEKADGGLQNIADENIKVIYLTRNTIDMMLSDVRHDQSKARNISLSDHCNPHDEECIALHKQATLQGVHFYEGSELLDWLKWLKWDDMEVIKKFERMNIDYLHVSYERLYDDEIDTMVEEWARILHFLGADDDIIEGLSYERIQEKFGFARTSDAFMTHKDKMSNYEEVKATLNGTEFYGLLD